MVFNRRKFLCGATAATLCGPTFLRALNASAATATKTILVTIQLDGGNDSFNTIVPIGSSAYGTYNDLRSNIAVSENAIQAAGTAFDANVATPAASATTYAFHPQMPELRKMYGNGQVALLMGIGLPADAAAREGHEEAKFAWSVGGINNFDQTNVGWLGAALDQVGAAGSTLPPMISLTGQIPLDMHGKVVPNLSISGNLSNFNPNSGSSGTDAATRLLALGRNDAYADPFMPAEFARSVALSTSSYVSGVQAIATAEPLADYVTTYAFTPGGTATYSGLKSQLQQIARLILGNAPTRAYWAVQGGHDSHSSQTTNQPPLLGEFSSAVSEFVAYLSAKSAATAANVVVMTTTDFGRRANSNSTDGTDHGTAGVNFVVGTSVKGGVYGAYPSLSKLDSDGNVYIAVDFRQQLAEVIASLGADPTAVLGGTFASLGFM